MIKVALIVELTDACRRYKITNLEILEKHLVRKYVLQFW